MFGAMDPVPNARSSAPAMAIRWQWSRLPELAPAEMYAALAARQQVFVVEQRCTFLDADGHDLHAWHLIAWDEARGAPAVAGYLRLLDPGRKFAEPSIGRVLTVAPYRGIGFGQTMMAEGIARTRGAWPGWPIRIAAQQRLERFYADFGFRAAGAPYLEDDISHVDMILPAAA